jgi:hypothetical protein
MNCHQEQPEWAIVYWPHDQTLQLIHRRTLWYATVEGAELIADERDLLPIPVHLNSTQSNPRRSDDDGQD